jgi:Tfp pilus assembly protein PilF
VFSHAIAVTRGNYIAHGNLSAHYFVMGDLGRAREHCVESLRITPLQPTAWNNLGAIEAALGHEKAALYAYERAVLLDPKSAKASFHFGELLARAGQVDAAVVMLRRAGELEPRWDAPRAALSALGR